MTIAHGCGTARVLKPSRSGFVCSVPFVTWSEDGKSNYGRARKESRSGSLRTADYLSRRLGFRLVEPPARREAAAAWRPNSAAEIFGYARAPFREPVQARHYHRDFAALRQRDRQSPAFLPHAFHAWSRPASRHEFRPA